MHIIKTQNAGCFMVKQERREPSNFRLWWIYRQSNAYGPGTYSTTSRYADTLSECKDIIAAFDAICATEVAVNMNTLTAADPEDLEGDIKEDPLATFFKRASEDLKKTPFKNSLSEEGEEA